MKIYVDLQRVNWPVFNLDRSDSQHFIRKQFCACDILIVSWTLSDKFKTMRMFLIPTKGGARVRSNNLIIRFFQTYQFSIKHVCSCILKYWWFSRYLYYYQFQLLDIIWKYRYYILATSWFQNKVRQNRFKVKVSSLGGSMMSWILRKTEWLIFASVPASPFWVYFNYCYVQWYTASNCKLQPHCC